MGTVTSVGSGNYETGSTWDSGARAGNADDVVIASGHNVTLAQDEQANSLTIESGGTLTITGATRKIRVDSENGSGFAVDIDGAIVESGGGKLRLDIETPAATKLDLMGSSGNVHDLVINHASCVATMYSDVSLSGDLTITAGQLTTGDGGYGYSNLTVTGDASVTGTLTGNTSSVSLGSLTIAGGGTYSATSGTTTITSENGTKCFDNQSGGTFTHNNGSLKFASSIGDTTFDNAGADDFYNLTCETNGDCKYLNAITVLNNLTINHSNANFAANTDASGAITVHGITRLVLGIAFATSDDNANADHYGFIQVEGGTFRISDTSSATKTCDGIRNIGGTIDG